MALICVSGKSGSGKSFFSKNLAQMLDGEYVCVDEISHASLKDEKIKKQFTEKFGKTILNNENEIDTKKLGKIVFSNPDDLDFINQISWKFIDEKIDEIIEKNKNRFMILDYALIVKMKYFSQSDYTFLIESDASERFSRIAQRDNVSTSYIVSRENNSSSYNASDFDFVIENNGSLDEFLKKISEIAENILSKKQKTLSD